MASSEVDWENLPELLLHNVFKQVLPYSDFLRSTTVCKVWREVAVTTGDSIIIERLKTCSNNQLPMLMVATSTGSNDHQLAKNSQRALYSLTSQKVLQSYHLSIPYSFDCCGSSYGWLAFARGRCQQFKITLYNPFSDRKSIHLPPMKREESNFNPPHCFIGKVILSANPSVSRSDFYVVAIFDGILQLALLKYGQESWTHVDYTGPELIVDAIFHKSLLYSVTHWLKIVSIGVISNLEKNEKPPQPRKISHKVHKYSPEAYLFESSRGDLLVARRVCNYGEDEDNRRNTSRFEVYKVVLLGAMAAELKKVRSLGEDALFLGDNHSMSVSAAEYTGCQPDSIYFTNGIPNFHKKHGNHGIWIYNLKNGSIGKHYTADLTHKDMPPPIWIIPTPHWENKD